MSQLIQKAKENIEWLRTANKYLECQYEKTDTWGVKGLQKKLHGIRYGELTTITAGSGTGKTSFCRELAARLCDQGDLDIANERINN